jgi:hypothetical protein
MIHGSCFFQNDPVRPNSPPYIDSYSPARKFLDLETPGSLTFSIHAVDPDADQLGYEFVVLDSLGGVEIVDSVLSRSETAEFRPEVGGIYHVRGKAYDGSRSVYRDWVVTVVATTNDPPQIVWRSPDQDSISCVRGSRLQFHFGVDDDNEDALWYSYYVDDVPVKLHSRTSDLVYTFWQNRIYSVKGSVWDGEFSDSITWYVKATGDPDTIPPSAINDLEGWTGEDIGTIRLSWTAPGDDSTHGKATGYMVRTYDNPILTEKDWDDASEKDCDIRPSLAGSTEDVVIRGNLNPGTYLYVTVRAYDEFYRDDFGELSPLGNCIHLLVRGVDAGGHVINAWNGQGAQGICVLSENVVDTTDALGRYLCANLPKYASMLWVRDEHIDDFPGDFYDMYLPLVNLDWHFTCDFYVIPSLGLHSTLEPDAYGGRFYAFFKDISNTFGDYNSSTIHRGWKHWPLTVYNPPQVIGGSVGGETTEVDLQAAARGAMNEWEAMTGLDLFEETDNASTADVKIVYFNQNSKHRYIITAYNDDGTPAKKEVWIYLKHDMVPVLTLSHLVFAHEFGHILGLDHSINRGHVMLGYTLPEVHHVTTDEANAVRILYHAPPVYDYKYIIEE